MFLSDIASSMLRFKRYPSRDDYVLVSCAVIQAYPFLKATSGRPYVSLVSKVVSACPLLLFFYQDAIVQGLVNRFKEFRRDKSKPRIKSSVTSHSTNKGKSPGINKTSSSASVTGAGVSTNLKNIGTCCVCVCVSARRRSC